MEASSRDTARAKLVGLRPGDGDHCVEPAEHEPLEPFVAAVLPSATSETMYGGYYWHIRLMARMSTHDI
jgi:hypothetical protein